MLPILLALLLQGPAPVPAAARDPRPARAEALRQRLSDLGGRRARTDRPLPVREDELNAYLSVWPDGRPPLIHEMTVELEDQVVRLRGVVDIDRVPGKPTSPWNPVSWLSGLVPVEIAGRVESARGFVTVRWDEIRVASIDLSPALLRDIVRSSTRGTRDFPDGLDIEAPYRLPHGLQKIDVRPALALLVF